MREKIKCDVTTSAKEFSMFGLKRDKVKSPESDNRLKMFPRNYCDYPFTSVYVATNGNVAPCCEFRGSAGSVKHQSLMSIWNGTEFANLREAFKTNALPQACSLCSDREKNEGTSMRIVRLEEIAASQRGYLGAHVVAPSPRMIDVRFSNLCNLRCRSCGLESSSKWFSDTVALGWQSGDKAEIKSFEGLDILIEQFAEGIHSLEAIYFAGGEPLLMEDHYALLELLIARKLTHVKLTYTTNLTVLSCHGRDVTELWAHFPNVWVEASVDAPGARGHLIRKDFDWDKFVANVGMLRRKCPSAAIAFGITVSIFNISILADLIEALMLECEATPDAIRPHPLQSPTYFRTQVLPRALKKRARRSLEKLMSNGKWISDQQPSWSALNTRLRGILSYMDASDRSVELDNFREICDRLDEIRSEKTAIVLPELASIWDRKAR